METDPKDDELREEDVTVGDRLSDDVREAELPPEPGDGARLRDASARGPHPPIPESAYPPGARPLDPPEAA